MQRFARGEAFDERAMPGLDSEAIDFRAASESFAAVRRLGKRDLDTLRLVTAHQGRQVPTAGGVLLFGRAPVAHPGLAAFSAAFKPKRSLLVGGDCSPVEEFLSRPVADWLQA